MNVVFPVWMEILAYVLEHLADVGTVIGIVVIPIVIYNADLRKPKIVIKRLHLIKNPVNHLYEQGEIYLNEPKNGFRRYPFYISNSRYSDLDVAKFATQQFVAAQNGLLSETINFLQVEIINRSRREPLNFSDLFFTLNGNPTMAGRRRLTNVFPYGSGDNEQFSIPPGGSTQLYFPEPVLIDTLTHDYFAFPQLLLSQPLIIKIFYKFFMKLSFNQRISLRAAVPKNDSRNFKIKKTSNKIKFSLAREISKPTKINAIRANYILGVLLSNTGKAIDDPRILQKMADLSYRIAGVIEKHWYFNPEAFNNVDEFRELFLLRAQRLEEFLSIDYIRALEERFIFIHHITMNRDRFMSLWSNRPKGWNVNRNSANYYQISIFKS